MIFSVEVPSAISIRAKCTLAPSGTTLGYYSSATVVKLGTIIPSRTFPAMLFLPSRPAGSSSPIAVWSRVKQIACGNSWLRA